MKELLLKIKKYIEVCEEMKSWEWGNCRDVEEIIADEDMPDIYNEVLKAIEEQIK